MHREYAALGSCGEHTAVIHPGVPGRGRGTRTPDPRAPARPAPRTYVRQRRMGNNHAGVHANSSQALDSSLSVCARVQSRRCQVQVHAQVL